MKIAQETAFLSTCTKKHVGAVLVKDGRILSTGYNGAPSKTSHCTKKTCLRFLSRDNRNSELCKGVHAEINTIIQCAIQGTKIKKNTSIYCTHFPCMSCTKMLINAGIKEIIFKEEYEMNNLEKFNLISEAKIEIRSFHWKSGIYKKFYELHLFNIGNHINQIKKGIGL